MDLKMKSEELSTLDYPIWDLKVENGIVPIITDDEESMQTATLAGFLELGSIPQLPKIGVPWTDFLTKKISFGELDTLIRESINTAGQSDYYPKYDIENETLKMSVGKEI